MTCECCYCKEKEKPDNPYYIKGIQFAADLIEDEYLRLREGINNWRESYRKKEITDRILRNRVEYLELQLRYLGQWHDALAKEGNRTLKLIKDIDWKNYLYGDE